MKIGNTPNAQALTDHGAKVRCGTLQRCERGDTLLFAPNRADKDLGVTKVRRGGDAGDGYEAEPWIAERSSDMGTDLFSKQLVPGKGFVIAGSIIREGRVTRGAKVRVMRGGNLVATDVIESLRRFRDDVREVKEGQECGIGLGASVTVQEGDILEIIGEKSTRRTL